MFFDRIIAVLNSSTINYTHNANNELTAAGAVSYSYDQNGNTIQETNGTQITKYIYNSSNRLERVELPDGRIAEYKYDPFGRRISKTINNQTTYYLYADEGLIGEYDLAGNNIKSYGWIPDTIWGTNPVFMQENNNYYFYHNDHLGTPQKMTDEVGNVVWGATYTAFGEATVDPSSTITNNLRFAGQYFDEETGKHYNWNRYYDPKTGRYTQVDPIGFEAGDGNLYRYVRNLPTSLTDSFGLFEPNRIDPGQIDPNLTTPAAYRYEYSDPVKLDWVCFTQCMGKNLLSPIIIHTILETVKYFAEHEGVLQKGATLIARGYYTHKYPKWFKAGGTSSKVLVPGAAGKIAGFVVKGVSIIGWGYFAYEGLVAVDECLEGCGKRTKCKQ